MEGAHAFDPEDDRVKIHRYCHAGNSERDNSRLLLGKSVEEGNMENAKPQGKRVRSRRSVPSLLPYAARKPLRPKPTNEDIMKAIDEIKANQQQRIDEFNRLKQHILFIDRLSLKIFIDSNSEAALWPLPPLQGPVQFHLNQYHSLPAL